MEELTPELIQGIPKNGATDPIEYYSRPLVGFLFRKRINLGLRLIPEGTYPRVLEIGYGSGALLSVLARSAGELHGIDLDADPAPVQAQLLARGLRAQLRQGSIYELPYATGTFDLVVCFSVFEHLHDLGKALGETHRVLRPGGLFLLGMPAVNPLMTRLFQAIGHNTINDIHVATPAMLARAFPPAGFRLIDSRCLDFPLPRPVGFRLYHNWLLAR